MKEQIINKISKDVTSLAYIFRKHNLETEKEMLDYAIQLSGDIHNKLLSLCPKG